MSDAQSAVTSVKRVILIEEIGLDDQGCLFVRPSAATAAEFEYIWRAAMGIRWDSNDGALHAYESTRWAVADLYQQMIAAVLDEYGIRLQATPGTVWSRIPADVRKEIEALHLNTNTD